MKGIWFWYVGEDNVSALHVFKSKMASLYPAKLAFSNTSSVVIVDLSWIHTRMQAFFYRFVACAFPFFKVMSV